MADINQQNGNRPFEVSNPTDLAKELVVPGGMNIRRAEVLVDRLVDSFRQHDGGMVELTLPKGIAISELGSGLNTRAKAAGISYRVWYDGSSLWDDMESSAQLQSERERTYRFVIRPSSIGKHSTEQIREYGPAAPLEVIALAESVNRLLTKDARSLFRMDGDKHSVKVRGDNGEHKLSSSFYYGVHSEFDNGAPSSTIAYAQQIF